LGLGENYTLPGYGRANAALGYEAENWSLIGFVDNLFNDFSESSAANTLLNNQLVPAFDGDANPANVWRFRTNVLRPRSIGARFKSCRPCVGG
jgi:outer membrane receptor protein involved in Fe transport